MSDLPEEMTKQIVVAPPRTMRSTRYSLTARGRSTPRSSMRLPTGSSSLEKASGWMRLPAPAAGMMPHMRRPARSVVRDGGRRGGRAGGTLERRLQLGRAVGGGVLAQGAVARGAAHPAERLARQLGGGHRLVGGAGDEDLAPRLEELVEPLPPVAEHRGVARRRLEEAS